jgi:DNA repair photolyase
MLTTDTLLDIQRLYFDPEALKFQRGREVFEKYKNVAELIEVDGHWKIEELNQNPQMVQEWNQVKAHFLVLGIKTSIASRPNCRSTDLIAPSHSSGCAMACSYCLPAGTMIETPSGAKPIEQIQDGDLVLAYDSSSERLVEALVSGVTSREVQEVIEIEVDGVTLQPSFEHPMMTRRGWIEAQNLTGDDEVLCNKIGLEFKKISSIKVIKKTTQVYNFHVPKYESYLANGMVTHNCYVARRKGYANPITVFANIDKIMKHIERKCERLGPKVITPENAQCDPVLWTWDIGENNDCSVDDMVSHNVRDLIDMFARIPNAKGSFATKFVNRNLLNYDPKGHTRIRFSLMPHKASRVVDVRTSPISERIAAINDFVAAGYEVHINLSPVIIYDGWQNDYVELLTELDDVLDQRSKKQLKAEVIFLTHNEKLHELNMQWHPKAEEHFLWRHWDSEDNKTTNKFGLPVIQQRKLSQNGMVNLRYKNNVKSQGIDQLRDIMERVVPYCQIRYIF